MGRIVDILDNARETLNDSAKERWSDADLLSLLDEGQKDLAKQADILKDIIAVPLRTAEHTYILPSNTVNILRAIFNGKDLPIKSTNFMDSKGFTGRLLSNIPYTAGSSSFISSDTTHWLNAITEGDIRYLVFDKLRRQHIRVWPTPTNTDLSEVLTSLNTNYGVTVSIDDYDDLASFGLVTSALDTDSDFTQYNPDVFGILVEMVSENAVVLHRSFLPETKITAIDDELEVDELCDEALQHYVAGKAFRQDTIVENRSKGNEELTFYNRELTIIKGISSASSVSTDHHDTTYNSMGD